MARAPKGKQQRDADGKLVAVGGRAANGSGSVYYSNGDGRWRGTYYDPTGKQRVVSGKTRTAVEIKLRERQEQAQEQAERAAQGPTLAVAAREWVERRATQPTPAETELRASTIGAYRGRAERIATSRLGKIPVGLITLADLRAWQDEQTSRLATKTVKDDLLVISETLTAAIVAGWRTDNPAREVRFARRTKPKQRTLTPTEIRAILSAAEGHRLAAAVFLLFTTGARVSEVLGLAWEDVDLDAGTVEVRRAWVNVAGQPNQLTLPKTTGALGVHHLAAGTLDQLRQLQAEHAGLDGITVKGWPVYRWEGRPIRPLFLTQRGTIIKRQTISKLVKTLATEAGIPDPASIGTHTARRSVVTALDSAGVDMARISDLVGHDDQTTTAGYSHRAKTRDQATAALWHTMLDDSH